MSDQNTRYYIRFKGRVLGPLTIEKAKELAKRGQITKQHELSTDGNQWQLAQNVSELFANERSERKSIEIDAKPIAPSIPELPKKIEWYAFFNNSNQGPVDITGMKEWISSGLVNQDTMIWCQGMSDWQLANQVHAEWFRDSRSGSSTSPSNSSTHLNVSCPHCNQLLSVPASAAGSVVPCFRCRGKFQIQAPIASPVWNPVYGASITQNEIRNFASKKIAAGICGILLGGLGVHKFVLGLNAAGAIMLCTWVLGVTTGVCIIIPVFASFAMGIIGLIEGIIYLTKTDEDFYQSYAVQKRQWF